MDDSPCLLDQGGLRGVGGRALCGVCALECHPLALAYICTGSDYTPPECHALALGVYPDDDTLGEGQHMASVGGRDNLQVNFKVKVWMESP